MRIYAYGCIWRLSSSALAFTFLSHTHRPQENLEPEALRASPAQDSPLDMPSGSGPSGILAMYLHCQSLVRTRPET